MTYAYSFEWINDGEAIDFGELPDYVTYLICIECDEDGNHAYLGYFELEFYKEEAILNQDMFPDCEYYHILANGDAERLIVRDLFKNAYILTRNAYVKTNLSESNTVPHTIRQLYMHGLQQRFLV